MRCLALLVLAALAAAAPDDDRRLKPDHAPTPYTAAQIRAACPDGRVVVFRVEQPGQPPVRQMLRFARGDQDGTDVEVTKMAADGAPLGSPVVARAAWKDLQGHASYPEAGTTITEETVTTPAGEFACLVYTVTDGGATRRFWFAKELAGPPVKLVATAGEKTVMALTLVEYRPFDFARCFGPQEVAEADGATDAQITLEVVKGESLAPSTVTTLHGGEVKAGVMRMPAADELYVVATAAAKVETAVRVTKGPLKGAVIHVRGAKSLYPLPRGAPIPPGPLTFEQAKPAAPLPHSGR